MATVVNGTTDSSNSAAMLILALAVAAIVGFGIYFFSANGGANKTDINIEAPKMSAPSAPSMPAPSLPTPSAPSSGQ